MRNDREKLYDSIAGGLCGAVLLGYIGYEYAGWSVEDRDADPCYQSFLKALNGESVELGNGFIAYDDLPLCDKLLFDSMRLSVDCYGLKRSNVEQSDAFRDKAMRAYTDTFLRHMGFHDVKIPLDHYLYDSGELHYFEEYYKTREITDHERDNLGGSIVRGIPFAIMGREDLAQLQATLTGASIYVKSQMVELCKITSDVLSMPFSAVEIIKSVGGMGEVDAALYVARASHGFGEGAVRALEAFRDRVVVLSLCGYLLGLEWGLESITGPLKRILNTGLLGRVEAYARKAADLWMIDRNGNSNSAIIGGRG